MEDHCVDVALSMDSSGGCPKASTNFTRAINRVEHDCSTINLRGSEQRYSTISDIFEESQRDSNLLRRSLAIRAICPVEHHGISQPKAFSPNSVVNVDDMEAMAMSSTGFQPDYASSLRDGESSPEHEHDCHLPIRNTLVEEEEQCVGPIDRLSRQNDVFNTVSTSPGLHGVSPVNPGAFDAVELNSKIEAMMAATKALKPNGASTLRPVLKSPSKNSRPKDSNVLTKMKAAISHPFHPSKKSLESGASSCRGMISHPTLTSLDIIPQSAVLERRINEG